jgi:broad specificity phosphatase PhoE
MADVGGCYKSAQGKCEIGEKTGRNADTAGRSPQQVMDRLDELITDIRIRFHKPAMSADKDIAPCADVLIVAHGHILRAFAMRWIGRQLTDGVSLLLEGESESLMGGVTKEWQSTGDGNGRGGWSG